MKIRNSLIPNGVDQRIEERIQELKEDFDSVVSGRLAFENGNNEKRREIILLIGSNFTLIIYKLGTIDHILTAFDDVVQVGLIKLRTTEIKSLGSQLAVAN